MIYLKGNIFEFYFKNLPKQIYVKVHGLQMNDFGEFGSFYTSVSGMSTKHMSKWMQLILIHTLNLNSNLDDFVYK